jgi:alpha-ketoglutaric semialdehyde dehydrogenase
MQEILVGGRWRPAEASETFRAVDPTTGRECDEVWPVSDWADIDAALEAATAAAAELGRLPDAARGAFLEAYAAKLEADRDPLVAIAHAETGLAIAPRLRDVEFPRMLDQLRQAAAAAREGTWRMAMIDTARTIRSAAFGLGPVVVFPPANFPLAYGGLTGGDFAAAIAGGNPVIAKAHPGCPGVSFRAARAAVEALREAGLPASTVQLLHGISPADGLRLVADPRVGATAFTGSEQAGRALFAAASAAGRVIWVEMGSINPVVILPGALAERGTAIAGELVESVTGSAGQFCTKPGLVFYVADEAGQAFAADVADRMEAIGPQVLLSPGGRNRLERSLAALGAGGARTIVAGGGRDAATACSRAPTLLEIDAASFLARPDAFLVEAFGNATLLVSCADVTQLVRAAAHARGSLGASLYAARDGRDDAHWQPLADVLVARSGRIVENRMPTGLAVTPPMQHGGPWPSAAPPFFSAVGLPFSILRFARRICFDGWTESRLPECLRDTPPPGRPWRFIDREWVRR